MSKRSKLKSYLVTVSATESKIGDMRPNIGKPLTLTHTDYRTVRSYEPITAKDCSHLAVDLQKRLSGLGTWNYSACAKGVFTPADISAPTITIQEIKKAKPRKTPPMKRVAATDLDYERRAVDYARWLMRRDGIEIPDYPSTKCLWADVYSNSKINKNGKPVYERRIKSVCFGYYEDKWSKHGFVSEFEFVLPNWDFNPSTPIEIIDGQDQGFLPCPDLQVAA